MPGMVRRFLCGLALTALAGCVEAVDTLPGFVQSANDGGFTASDALERPDASVPSEDASGADATASDAGSCIPGFRRARVTLGAGALGRFAASRTGLFVERRSTDQTWIEKVDWATGAAEVSLREDERDALQLLAVHDDDLVVARSVGRTGSEVWWRSAARGYERLGAADTTVFRPRVRRWAANGLAVFIDEDTPRGELVGRNVDGTGIFQGEVLAASVRGDTLALLGVNRMISLVAIATGTNQREVQRFDVPATSAVRPPLLTASLVYWQTGEAVWRAPRSNLQPELVVSGCDLLAVEGGGAVVVGCDPDSSAATRVYGRLLWGFGGTDLTPVFGVQGVVTGAVLIDNARLVWVEYQHADVLCGGADDQAGRVRSWVLGTRALPVDIAEVRAPCLCCDIVQPGPIVDGMGMGAIWNYDFGTPDPVDGPFGYAAWVTCDDDEP